MTFSNIISVCESKGFPERFDFNEIVYSLMVSTKVNDDKLKISKILDEEMIDIEKEAFYQLADYEYREKVILFYKYMRTIEIIDE